MKKILLMVLSVSFFISSSVLLNPVGSFAFSLKLKRDPFMDLLKLSELRKKESILLNKSMMTKERQVQERIESVVNSISVQMVVYSKTDPKMNTALIVGPSGESVVVYKNYKLDKDVYVSKIIDNGIVLSFKTKKGTKNATIKMKKTEGM